jgi:hypothetical protein
VLLPGVVALICDPKNQEAKVGGWEVHGHHGLQNKTQPYKEEKKVMLLLTTIYRLQ